MSDSREDKQLAEWQHRWASSAENSDRIDAEPAPRCICCNGDGDVLYHDVSDRLYGADGRWTFRKCRSQNCGLIWLDPMPTRQDIGKAYSSYYTHSIAPKPNGMVRRLLRHARRGYLAQFYGYQPGRVTSWHRLLGLASYGVIPVSSGFDWSVMHLPSVPKGRFLDVGCGDGRQLADMAELGWDVEGIDVDSVAVEICRGRGLSVHAGDIEELGFPNESFDAIGSSHVIEHVHDPRSFLRECFRVLKPHGVVSIMTPNTASFGHHLFNAAWRGLEPPRHLHLFNLHGLQSLLNSEGFEVLRAFTTVRAAETMYVASREILHDRSSDVSKFIRIRRMTGGIAFMICEMALRLVNRHAGEELVIVARKPRS